jgi:hypothetical protein
VLKERLFAFERSIPFKRFCTRFERQPKVSPYKVRNFFGQEINGRNLEGRALLGLKGCCRVDDFEVFFSVNRVTCDIPDVEVFLFMQQLRTYRKR